MVLVKPGTKIPVDGSVVDGRQRWMRAPSRANPCQRENSRHICFCRDGQPGRPAPGSRHRYWHRHNPGAHYPRVEEAQDEKAPTQRFIERFAKWYTPAIIGLSGVAYLISRDIELALTLLVIGCPGRW